MLDALVLRVSDERPAWCAAPVDLPPSATHSRWCVRPPCAGVRRWVRWAVSSQRFEDMFRTKALAHSFRAELVQAANAGEPFDPATGRPVSEARTKNPTTWYAHSRTYVEMKWPRAAAKTRRSIVEALIHHGDSDPPDQAGRPLTRCSVSAVPLRLNRAAGPTRSPPSTRRSSPGWKPHPSGPSSWTHPRWSAESSTASAYASTQARGCSTVQRKRATFYNVLGTPSSWS